MFYKKVANGYITMFGEGKGATEISESEYNRLKEVMHTRPDAPSGFDYRLKEDLMWELYELPPVEESEEATEADYQAALREMGVEV